MWGLAMMNDCLRSQMILLRPASGVTLQVSNKELALGGGGKLPPARERQSSRLILTRSGQAKGSDSFSLDARFLDDSRPLRGLLFNVASEFGLAHLYRFNGFGLETLLQVR